MLPYLVNPAQPSIRKTNFTEIGTNLHANGEINGPCQYNTTTCTQIAPTKSVCEDNSGIWWGAGATDPSTAGIPSGGLKLCCDVAVWQANHAQTISTDIYPLEAFAIRNDHYKLVINDYQAYDATSNSCVATSTKEFYQINENVPLPKLDTARCRPLGERRQAQSAAAEELRFLDRTVQDAPGVAARLPWRYQSRWGRGLSGCRCTGRCSRRFRIGNSSWADINLDGLTDGADLAIILQNQGACPG